MKKNIIRCRLCVRPLWNMMDVSNSCATKSMPKEKSFTDFASSFAIVSLVRLLCAAFTVAVRVQASAMKTYFQIAECSLYLYKCTYKKSECTASPTGKNSPISKNVCVNKYDLYA